jgi:hypothetical protein
MSAVLAHVDALVQRLGSGELPQLDDIFYYKTVYETPLFLEFTFDAGPYARRGSWGVGPDSDFCALLLHVILCARYPGMSPLRSVAFTAHMAFTAVNLELIKPGRSSRFNRFIDVRLSDSFTLSLV